jgi:transcriptional regulator with XRE-family HTH domain
MSDAPIRSLPTIGDAVRAAREARHVSAGDLAVAADVPLPTLLALEDGRPNPPVGQLVKLARALDTQASVLIADAEARVREAERAPQPRERRWQLRRSADELEATLTFTLPGNRLAHFLASRLFKRDD